MSEASIINLLTLIQKHFGKDRKQHEQLGQVLSAIKVGSARGDDVLDLVGYLIATIQSKTRDFNDLMTVIAGVKALVPKDYDLKMEFGSV